MAIKKKSAPKKAAGKKIKKKRSANTCFVIMPFAKPIGPHYKKIYEPAITNAGLKPMRVDDEIFGPGIIMKQIWSGIKAAKVIVAVLTVRNPNVFYELGMAHALAKPTILISGNKKNVPFDLLQYKVIEYDVNDPEWGKKLGKKVSKAIRAALKNPEDAVYQV
jgi:hypothetical protein